MWPNLFGPDWIWMIFAGLALLLGIGLGAVALMARVGPKEEDRTAGPTGQDLWHRYEEGDLTPGEFERLAEFERRKSKPAA